MQNDDLFPFRGDADQPDDALRTEGSAAPAATSLGAANIPDTDTIQRPLPDPFVDNLGIEYWIWNGTRLVPAWPDEVDRIRSGEHLRMERAKQAAEERAAQRRVWWAIRAQLEAAAACVRRFLGIPPALLPSKRPRKRPHRSED